MKLCIKCGIKKPKSDFLTPQGKICTICKTDTAKPTPVAIVQAKTDAELQAEYLKSNKPKVFPAVEPIYEPPTSIIKNQPYEVNNNGDRVYQRLNKHIYSTAGAMDETIRNFGT